MNQSMDYSIMTYRREQLEKEMEEIRNIVSGREESFLAEIRDDEGKCDPEKLENFIDRILESYQEYVEYEDMYLPEEQTRRLEGDIRRLLHHFLYLSILGPICYVDYNNFGLTTYSSPVTYQDILSLAGRLEYHDSLQALYEAEAYYDTYALDACLEPSLFDQVNGFYYDLSGGTRITETYELPREEWDPEDQWGSGALTEMEESTGEGTGTVEESPAQMDDSTPGEAGIAAQSDIPGKGISDLEYEDLCRSMGEMNDMDQLYDSKMEESKTTYQRWKETLPDAAEYCRIYLELRKLYTNHTIEDRDAEGARGLAWFARNLDTEVTNMIDAYLFRNQISPYSLGQSYGLVAARMKNTSQHLRAELARARRMKA